MNPGKLARSLSGIALAYLLYACTTPPQTRTLLQHRPQQLSTSVNLESVAFYPQDEFQCGPAALASLLNYQGIPIEPEQLTHQVYIPELRGSLQIEMLATARRYGLVAYPLAAELQTLVTEIHTGHPVLVLQNLAYSWWPQWHYAIVVGYDLDKGSLLLRSGTFREYELTMETFERTWQRADYWAYLLLKPGLIPATAEADSYLQSVLQLEQTGQSNQALSAIRSAARHWPDHSGILLALSNSEYQAGQLKDAARTLYRLLAEDPDFADAWNNLAYLLAEQQCSAGAIKAIQCALSLDPNNPNIQHSYQQLSQIKDQPSGNCPVLRCPDIGIQQ